MSLVGYDHPSSSPQAHLLHQARREEVADTLNRVLLNAAAAAANALLPPPYPDGSGRRRASLRTKKALEKSHVYPPGISRLEHVLLQVRICW